jgi:hypothetical protein
LKAPGTIKFYRGTTLITVKNSQLAGFEQILGLDNGASRDTLIALTEKFNPAKAGEFPYGTY